MGEELVVFVVLNAIFDCEMKEVQYMETTLKQRIARYTEAKRFLTKHPEHKEMLERKVKEAEVGIIQYVTSDYFIHQLDYLNL